VVLVKKWGLGRFSRTTQEQLKNNQEQIKNPQEQIKNNSRTTKNKSRTTQEQILSREVSKSQIFGQKGVKESR